MGYVLSGNNKVKRAIVFYRVVKGRTNTDICCKTEQEAMSVATNLNILNNVYGWQHGYGVKTIYHVCR